LSDIGVGVGVEVEVEVEVKVEVERGCCYSVFLTPDFSGVKCLPRFLGGYMAKWLHG